jgi:hypothetical protein
MAALRYIYQNPVRAGLVKKAEDYPASGLSWFQDRRKKGIIAWEDLKLAFVGEKGLYNKLVIRVNDRIERNPFPVKNRKSMIGSKKWKSTVLEIIKDHPAAKQTAKEIRPIEFCESTLSEALREMDEKHRTDAEILLRFQYGRQKVHDIRKEMDLKSDESTMQRMHRFRKKIAQDERLKSSFSRASSILTSHPESGMI